MQSVIVTLIVMVIVGAVLGAILGISDSVFHVEVDQRVETVTGMLPGYNCGGCGFAGCSGCAQALVDGTITTVGVCKPSKPEAKQKIADYLNSTPGPNGETLHVTVS